VPGCCRRGPIVVCCARHKNCDIAVHAQIEPNRPNRHNVPTTTGSRWRLLPPLFPTPDWWPDLSLGTFTPTRRSGALGAQTPDSRIKCRRPRLATSRAEGSAYGGAEAAHDGHARDVLSPRWWLSPPRTRRRRRRKTRSKSTRRVVYRHPGCAIRHRRPDTAQRCAQQMVNRSMRQVPPSSK
jgi:hypothetical protein